MFRSAVVRIGAAGRRFANPFRVRLLVRAAMQKLRTGNDQAKTAFWPRSSHNQMEKSAPCFANASLIEFLFVSFSSVQTLENRHKLAVREVGDQLYYEARTRAE